MIHRAGPVSDHHVHAARLEAAAGLLAGAPLAHPLPHLLRQHVCGAAARQVQAREAGGQAGVRQAHRAATQPRLGELEPREAGRKLQYGLICAHPQQAQRRQAGQPGGVRHGRRRREDHLLCSACRAQCCIALLQHLSQLLPQSGVPQLLLRRLLGPRLADAGMQGEAPHVPRVRLQEGEQAAASRNRALPHRRQLHAAQQLWGEAELAEALADEGDHLEAAGGGGGGGGGPR